MRIEAWKLDCRESRMLDARRGERYRCTDDDDDDAEKDDGQDDERI